MMLQFSTLQVYYQAIKLEVSLIIHLSFLNYQLDISFWGRIRCCNLKNHGVQDGRCEAKQINPSVGQWLASPNAGQENLMGQLLGSNSSIKKFLFYKSDICWWEKWPLKDNCHSMYEWDIYSFVCKLDILSCKSFEWRGLFSEWNPNQILLTIFQTWLEVS